MEGENVDVPGAAAPPRHATLVLVVEDEWSIAEALVAVVEEAGYPVQAANNGKQALAVAPLQWPAVVISDVMMPVMDGVKLVAALRRLAAHWNLPMPAVVLMTAAHQRAVEGVVVDAVIGKPFDITTIEAFLRRVLA